MSSNKWQIEYVPYGMASRFPGKRIILHEKLREIEYLPLQTEIITHEKEHTDKGWHIKDLTLDVRGFKNKYLYWKFMFTTLSAWTQFIPIGRYKGKWFIDWTIFGVEIVTIWLLWIAWRTTGYG